MGKTPHPRSGFFDYDGDGWLDIYLLNSRPLPGRSADLALRNAFFCNQQDGTFVEVTDQAGVGDAGYGMGLCVGDYDRDLDLARLLSRPGSGGV